MNRFLLVSLFTINFSSLYGATLLPSGVNKNKCVNFRDI